MVSGIIVFNKPFASLVTCYQHIFEGAFLLIVLTIVVISLFRLNKPTYSKSRGCVLFTNHRSVDHFIFESLIDFCSYAFIKTLSWLLLFPGSFIFWYIGRW